MLQAASLTLFVCLFRLAGSGWSPLVSGDNLELLAFLPAKYWHFNYAPPYLVYGVLDGSQDPHAN